MRDPRTPEEWREAVVAAAAMLLVDSAEKYGILAGPAVDVARCEDLIKRGRELGYVASEEEIDAVILGRAR